MPNVPYNSPFYGDCRTNARFYENIRDLNSVTSHQENNMSADDSFRSDSDNSLPEPINEIESGEENYIVMEIMWESDHIALSLLLFQSGTILRNNE